MKISFLNAVFVQAIKHFGVKSNFICLINMQKNNSTNLQVNLD